MSRKTSETTSQTTGMVRRKRLRVCFMRLDSKINQRTGIRGWGSVSEIGGGGSEIGGGFLEHFNADPGDAARVHFDHGEPAAVELDRFAGHGNVAELNEHEAGKGFHAAFAGQAPVHLRFKIAKVDAAVHQQGAAGGGKDGAQGVVELVVKLAGELLHGIFGGDEADDRAKLVDGDGDLA